MRHNINNKTNKKMHKYIITYRHALDQTKTIVNVTFSNDIHVLGLRDCEKVNI